MRTAGAGECLSCWLAALNIKFVRSTKLGRGDHSLLKTTKLTNIYLVIGNKLPGAMGGGGLKRVSASKYGKNQKWPHRIIVARSDAPRIIKSVAYPTRARRAETLLADAMAPAAVIDRSGDVPPGGLIIPGLLVREVSGTLKEYRRRKSLEVESEK
jgi:hypothetical protein